MTSSDVNSFWLHYRRLRIDPAAFPPDIRLVMAATWMLEALGDPPEDLAEPAAALRSAVKAVRTSGWPRTRSTDASGREKGERDRARTTG